MALNIKSDLAHRLAKELAEATGQNLTEAVTEALRQSLAAAQESEPGLLMAQVSSIQRFVAGIPHRDGRIPEEILGYDALGMPR